MKPATKSVTKAVKAKASGKKISPTGRILADPVVSCRPEEDGALLFNPDTDTTLLINATGLIVWNFVQEPHTIEDIAMHLMTVFGDIKEKPAVKKDIRAFVGDLAPDFIIQEGADAKKPAAS